MSDNLLIPFVGGGAFLVGEAVSRGAYRLIDEAIARLPADEQDAAKAERESIYHELLPELSKLGHFPESIDIFKKEEQP